MLQINAPAKVNLTLEVLARRPDGYHEIWSIIQSVNLSDVLTFENSTDIMISCDLPGWSAEKSLVSKAVALVREDAGLSSAVKLDIKKRIPLVSGLGGDSSDAAAVLNGLNEFWKLDYPPDKLRRFAADLGSDVFYFLVGGTAFAGGRGERVKSLPSLPESWLVIVVPDVLPVPGKTAAMYAALEPSHFTDGLITRKFVDVLAAGTRIDTSFLFNTFENIAFRDDNLLKHKEHLLKLGAPNVHLCGCGPALYTLFDDKTSAEELYTCCTDQGMEVYLADTL